MNNFYLFPISEYWWLYSGFLIFVLSMLALDLGVFHRDAHAVSLKEAAAWSITWVGLASLFCLGLWAYTRWKLPQYEPLIEHLADRGVVGQMAEVEVARLADRIALE